MLRVFSMNKIYTGECNFLKGLEMSTDTGKLLQNSDLAYQYTWYSDTFAHKIKDVAEDFFDKSFDVYLLGICENINSLAGKESYFVTKIKIDKQHDVFFRLSDTAVKVILDKVLGHANKKFDIEHLTNFETNHAKNLSHMFENCENLDIINLSKFNKETTRNRYSIIQCKTA